MRINIYLPSIPILPTGGYKIMYEYAKQFSKAGHDIVIYNIYTNPYFSYKAPYWLRCIRNEIFYHNYRPYWYNLEKNIVCKNIPQLNKKHVRDADISFSTNWAIAFELNELPESKGKKINLIQGYELWIENNKQMLYASYRLPITHIVVADHLVDIVQKVSGICPQVIYNAIDHSVFNINSPISERNPHSISMLFSLDEKKGTQYGLKTLHLCKKEIPDLHVELFGVHPQPDNLKSWIKYTREPQDLCSLYNSTAIFFTPSTNEGWGLPATEAMSCGCALVCTNVDGHVVFAKNEETALLAEPKNPQDMAEKLLILLRDNEKRISLANKGNIFVKQFNWDRASKEMLSVFDS